MKQRVISIFILLVMGVSLLSPAALAEGEAEAPAGLVAAGDCVYLGQHWGVPIQWRVLDTSMSNGEGGLFLLSEYLMQGMGVLYAQAADQHWQGTTAQLWCSNFFTNSFSPAEQALIARTSGREEAGKAFGQDWNAVELKEEPVFFLSAPEAEKYQEHMQLSAQTRDGVLGFWWLRSTGTTPGYAGLVMQDNKVGSTYFAENWGARPALNLSSEKLLFVSDAAEESGLQAMEALRKEDGQSWKLTLLDENRAFSVSGIQCSGDEVEISYQGAMTGENEYISALTLDADGVPVSYGRLARAEAESGSLRIPLSQLDIPAGGSICLLSEQDNGPYCSDYASAPQKLQVSLRFEAGTGSGTMEPVSVDFGTAIKLPECSFLPAEGTRFDRWEVDGKPVTADTLFYGSSVLTAVYRDIQAESISVDKPLLTLSLSDSVQIHGKAEPDYAAHLPIRWLCEDSKYISLTDHGDGSCTVTAKYPGKTILRAVSVDGNAQTEIEVTVTGSAQRAAMSSVLPVLIVVLALAVLAFAALLFYRRRQQRKAWNSWEEGDYLDAPASAGDEPSAPESKPEPQPKEKKES